MGYTHYWNVKKRPTNKQWDKIEAAIKKLYALKEIKPLIRYESDSTTPPMVNAEFVRFNGRDDDGHETFYFGRDMSDFEFCKTAEKPYDVAVVACLCIIDHYAPNLVGIKSDGYRHEWVAGQALASKVIGEPVEIPKEVKEAKNILTA